MDCGELLCGKRLPPKMTGAVYKSHLRPGILHRSEK